MGSLRRTFASIRGSTVLLMLGLLSILILVGIGLFRRVGAHTQTITLLDQTLILRNVLESYSSDVFQFIRREANHKDSALYQRFRAAPGSSDGEIPPESIGYSSSILLQNLVKQYKGGGTPFSVEPSPKITLSGCTPLKLCPMLFFVDPAKAVNEYQGEIHITTVGTFGERTFRLTARYPFKVTFLMLPMLREFAWFFDQLHLEQEEGKADGINVLSLKEDDVEPGQWPLILDSLETDPKTSVGDGSKTTIELGDPDKNGKVFFGGDRQPLFFQLGGELQPTQAAFSDLGMIKPSHFNIVTEKNDKMYLEDLSVVGFPHQVRGFSKFLGPPISPSSLRTTSWIFGFSDETAQSGEKKGFFAKSLKLDTFLADDPGFKALNTNPSLWRLSAALKPLGLSKDPQFFRKAVESGSLPSDAVGYSIIPARQIFGDLFRKFLMLSFFVVPSCAQGEGEEMKFSADPGFKLTAKQIRGSQIFEPPAGTLYRDYMSKVISGDPAKKSEGYSSLIQPYNVRPGGAMGPPLRHGDYQGVDGLRIASEMGFSQYRSQMLNVTPLAPGSPPPSGLQERVTRYYPDGTTFLLQARGVRQPEEESKRFWVSGTVVVDKDLDLAGGIAADDIRGGVIIVNGPLTLGDVVPAKIAPLFPAAFESLENLTGSLREAAKKTQPEEILTFVVLNGHPIKLVGRRYFGIHLVSLHDGPTPLIPPAEPFLLCGALALSRPDVARLSREMKRGSMFLYHPVMAVDKPPLAVDMDVSMSDYEFAIVQ